MFLEEVLQTMNPEMGFFTSDTASSSTPDQVIEAGANALVAGSAVFKAKDYKEGERKLPRPQALVEQCENKCDGKQLSARPMGEKERCQLSPESRSR